MQTIVLEGDNAYIQRADNTLRRASRQKVNNSDTAESLDTRFPLLLTNTSPSHT